MEMEFIGVEYHDIDVSGWFVPVDGTGNPRTFSYGEKSVVFCFDTVESLAEAMRVYGVHDDGPCRASRIVCGSEFVEQVRSRGLILGTDLVVDGDQVRFKVLVEQIVGEC